MNLRYRLSVFALFLALGCAPVLSQTSAGTASAPQANQKLKSNNQEMPPRISVQEAQELFQSLDETLKFVSEDTGLPLKRTVKRELWGREQLQHYVEEKLNEDEGQKRMERAELVMKKFGFLPRDFALRPFMVNLLREQVAGFYDYKRKTVFILDWLPRETQMPVMAHELTHVLQDQTIDLDKWLDGAREKSMQSPAADTTEVAMDEEIVARTAVVEGQGMAVLIDYLLKPAGRSLSDSPRIAEAIKAGIASNEGSPMLTNAPLLMRESLFFPYRDGLGFVQALLASGGKKMAYPDALTRPPRDSHEILTPASYLANLRPPAMPLPDMRKLMGVEFERYDVGAIGQFDTSVFLRQFSSEAAARELATEWRGGYYYAAVKKSGFGAARKELTTDDLALLYVSRWTSPEAAAKMAGIYGDALSKRYQDASPESGSARRWTTSEGAVRIELAGDTLIVTESMDEATSTKVIAALRTGAGGSKTEIKTGNIGLRVMAPVFAMRMFLEQRALGSIH